MSVAAAVQAVSLAAAAAAAAPIEYSIAFEADTIRNLLGFLDGVLSPGYNLSPDIVHIISKCTMLVKVDIIQGSYIDGDASPAFYAFNPGFFPGNKSLNAPVRPSLAFFLLSHYAISQIMAWLTDGNIVDL